MKEAEVLMERGQLERLKNDEGEDITVIHLILCYRNTPNTVLP